MSAVLVLPFHQDQRLGGDNIALPPDAVATLVEAELPAADQWQRLVTLYDRMAAQVASTVAVSGFTTVLTGDCLALLATLAGSQRAGLDPSLVWFDAHGDVHTLATSTSGYLGGMALRMALGGDADKLGEPLGLKPVPEERAVLVDARDLDPAEAAYLATSQVLRRTVEDVQIDDLPDGPLVLHVDLDVIDAAEVPGLRFPAPEGPAKSAVLDTVQRLVCGGRVSILDVACPWYEPADEDQQRVRRELLTELLDRSSSR
jgi:arginase